MQIFQTLQLPTLLVQFFFLAALVGVELGHPPGQALHVVLTLQLDFTLERQVLQLLLLVFNLAHLERLLVIQLLQRVILFVDEQFGHRDVLCSPFQHHLVISNHLIAILIKNIYFLEGIRQSALPQIKDRELMFNHGGGFGAFECGVEFLKDFDRVAGLGHFFHFLGVFHVLDRFGLFQRECLIGGRLWI